jgi:two-component system sensor kinase FixL
MQRCDYLRRCRSISIDSAQEGLTNALRHADTRLIKIILDIQPTTMSLAILDDGVGLPMQVESSAGMGLKLLRYRANLLRARIRIQPGSTRGTHLIFTIEQQP